MIKLTYSQKTLFRLILLILTALIVIFASYLFAQPGYKQLNLSEKGEAWFTHQPLLTEIFALFEVGVVDIESDNRLDVYTANHSGQQHFLHNNGDSGLSTDNAISQFGFNQDREFPGLDIYKGPQINGAGFYIYWTERSFILNNHQLQNIEPSSLNGEIQFSVPIKVKKNNLFDINVEDHKLPTGAEVSTVKFSAQSSNSKLDLSPYNASLPISFKLNSQIPLEQIYIGNQGVHPSSHEFTLYLRDRHGMAWTDLDEKGPLDVFIVRGGLRGKANLYPDHYVAGELLVSEKISEYENLSDISGIVKGCNANQTAWVDFDNDNLLDIYVSCTRGDRKFSQNSSAPNLLYRQVERGKFTNVAAEVNLDIPGSEGSFIWFDREGDGDLDLFWADEQSFTLYVNDSGKFFPETIESKFDSSSAQYKWFKYKLTMADYDSDGDIDLFAASPTGNLLVMNTNNKFELVKPTELGLPKSDLTANWVDYDNDGLIDLHLFPHGLYRQNQNGQFEATHMLENESSGLMTAICNWFDVNNDGSRDLIIATQYRSSLLKRLYGKVIRKISEEPVSPEDWNWTLALYPNLTNTNHWLEVKLIGTPGNRSAIGAKVELVNSDRTQTQVVGQSEGSRASQGHYRLYFGLGQNQQVDLVRVTWPDGTIQEITNPKIDRLLTINADNFS